MEPSPARYYCANCLFASVCEGEAQRTLSISPLQTWRKHQRITLPSDGSRIYIIRSGLLKKFYITEQGHEVISDFIWPGAMVGWKEMTARNTKASTVQAVLPSKVCALSAADMKRLVYSRPELLEVLWEALSQAYQSRFILDPYSTAEERLQDFLIYLTRVSDQDDRTWIGMPMPFYDIARFLGLTPETVSRAMKGLQAKGLIKKDNHAFRWQ